MKEKTFEIMNIESPGFIKQLNINELKALCDDIRSFIIDNVSVTGGHLASNLGSVEAIVAMHYIFDSPKDKFLFDVSHQAYTHKILTGRAKQFNKLRLKDGISGFTSYDESEHDVFESGHSSTAISAASGILEAKKFNKDINEVICFIGDASFLNGIAFEGLYYASLNKNQKMIIIVNDNDPLLTNKERINNIVKGLGFKCIDSIDGHNLEDLISNFKFAKDFSESIVLHINTIKGKGYKYSEEDKIGAWHGVSPFDINSGKCKNKIDENYISWSEGISLILEDLFKSKENVRLITPAMIYGSKLYNLKRIYNDKIIDVGINEEHAMIMASSMSRNKIVPFVSIYSTFLQRAYDYLNVDIARTKSHVVLLIDRCGLIGGDGATHQGIFDLSFLIPLPNLIICSPSNLSEAKALLDYAYKIDSPIAIRYPKSNTPKIELLEEYNEIKEVKWDVINKINDVNIITYGDFINRINNDSNFKDYGLINALFIKPIDNDLIKKLNNKKVVVIEEAIEDSSLYSLLLKFINDNNLNIKIKSISIKDKYPSLGTKEELLREFKLDNENILKELKKL